MNYKIITTSLLFIVSCMANDTKASVVAEDKKTEQTKPQSRSLGKLNVSDAPGFGMKLLV